MTAGALTINLSDIKTPLIPDPQSRELFREPGSSTFQLPETIDLNQLTNDINRGLEELRLFFKDFQFDTNGAALQSGTSSPVNQLVVFGDSLSDPGNLFKLSNQTTPPSPPYFEGRFSNGPIWIDYLAPRLGLNDDSVSNFAVGGATSGRDNIGNAQLGANVLPGLLNQIDTFVAKTDSKADPNSLFIVWAGGNDFQNVPNDAQAAAAAVNSSVANIATAVTTLANSGAQKILVPNQFNFGLTPFSNRRGISEQTTALTTAFNQALDQTLTNLEQSLKIDVIEVDLFSLGQRIAAAPGEFGFSNITDPLIEQTTAVNPDQFFWWDEVHPTTKVHELVADTFESAIAQAFPVVNGSSTHSPLKSDLFATAGFGSGQPLSVSNGTTGFGVDSPLMKI